MSTFNIVKKWAQGNQFSSTLSPEDLQVVWEVLATQLGSDMKLLAVEGALYRMWDQSAKLYFAKKFMEITKESAMYCRDGTGQDRVYLAAPRFFNAGYGMVVYPVGAPEPVWILRPTQQLFKVRVKEQKIPRPPNAYILYRKERHTMVKQRNPGITNNEISQVLGRCWNMESREVRAKYKDMAEQIKKAHREKHPDYQYKPRRPSEKRRRTKDDDDDEEEPPIVWVRAH
ncbi:hypothetical protein ACJ41O_010075 [Fusarium nematophilum]